MLAHALDAPGINLEYGEIRNPADWSAETPSGLIDQAVALVAASVGGVRLIDSMLLSDAPQAAVEAGAEAALES